MAKLKFLPPLKNLKAKRKSRFFKDVQKIATSGKFWLISALPVLFILYNHMRQRKKFRQKRNNTYLGVAVYTIFSVVAVIFLVFIFSSNIQTASGVSRQNISAANASGLDPSTIHFDQTMNDVDAYTRQNITALASANNDGGGGSTVDAVDFISINRALVFYHENSDKYLVEEVFKDDNHQVEIEKFILKIKNDTDYSGGVYGQ
jgi:ABC-type glutathione transport system ATPase component